MFVTIVLAAGCGDNAAGQACAGDGAELLRPVGWEIASHCKGAIPDYAQVFDDTVVHRLDIEIDAADVAAQFADMEDIFGPLGAGPSGGSVTPSREPMYVPITMHYNGRTWWQVGLRYKGNSSLKMGWERGQLKLPFRLDFDRFEVEHPELDNQRFWGFSKMTFSNGFNDPSLIRDKVAADLFRAGRVPAAFGAFVRVYVDAGDGPVYWGLYTWIEDVSNKMLDDQFTADTGNLYKPDGMGARLSQFVQADMEKKTNEAVADYSDVQAFIAALNATPADAATWRAELEATFDVDHFLRCRAMNQVMTNWDVYGWAPHNYYLYADPGNAGLLTWIPWDLNHAFFVPTDGMRATAGEIMMDSVGAGWPLLRRVLDDPIYRAQYQAHVRLAVQGPLSQVDLFAKFDAYHALVAPYVVGDEGEQEPYTMLRVPSDFDDSVDVAIDALKPHMLRRYDAVDMAVP